MQFKKRLHGCYKRLSNAMQPCCWGYHLSLLHLLSFSSHPKPDDKGQNSSKLLFWDYIDRYVLALSRFAENGGIYSVLDTFWWFEFFDS